MQGDAQQPAAMTDEQITAIALEHGCSPARAIIFARALLSAQARPQVPDGWQLVPKKATEEMENALNDHRGAWGDNYAAMLASAPPAPAQAAPAVQVHGDEPVAWRVRGYSQFKTGKPRAWRYFDGQTKPAVNTPDCCDIEPVFARPTAAAPAGVPSDVQRDAERYQWLREKTMERPDFYADLTRWSVSQERRGFGQCYSGERLDAAIDAARASSPAGSPQTSAAQQPEQSKEGGSR